MKFSKKLRYEVRIHLVFLAGASFAIPFYYLVYQLGLFFTAPPELVVCYGVFTTVCLYFWWRHRLASDKNMLPK